jgi:hypothetical protein
MNARTSLTRVLEEYDKVDTLPAHRFDAVTNAHRGAWHLMEAVCAGFVTADAITGKGWRQIMALSGAIA